LSIRRGYENYVAEREQAFRAELAKQSGHDRETWKGLIFMKMQGGDG